MPDAIPDHAEHGRDQRANIVERGQNHQQQDRAGLHHHVPAENERLHLERPGGEQVGRPLETTVAGAEGPQRGTTRKLPLNARRRGSCVPPRPFSCLLLVALGK
jgi:hypothetical protein